MHIEYLIWEVILSSHGKLYCDLKKVFLKGFLLLCGTGQNWPIAQPF